MDLHVLIRAIGCCGCDLSSSRFSADEFRLAALPVSAGTRTFFSQLP
jgi:hypothetical protein